MIETRKLHAGPIRVFCMLMILSVLFTGAGSAAASNANGVLACTAQSQRPGTGMLCPDQMAASTPGDGMRLASVSVYAFEVQPVDDGMLISWETANEIDKIGFYLYRQEEQDDAAVRITPDMIPVSDPGGMSGAFYEMVDTTAAPNTAYRYALQTVLLDGSFYMLMTAYEPPSDPQVAPGMPAVYQVFLPGIRR